MKEKIIYGRSVVGKRKREGVVAFLRAKNGLFGFRQSEATSPIDKS